MYAYDVGADGFESHPAIASFMAKPLLPHNDTNARIIALQFCNENVIKRDNLNGSKCLE